MNRRERTLSPVTTRRSHRLLPRIQYFNRTNPNTDSSRAEQSQSSWEFNDRSKEQSRRQCRQQQQRKRQQQEMKERMLDQLHSADAKAMKDDVDDDDNKSESSTPSVVDLIEKFELLPDNHDAGNDAGSTGHGDADSIFSDEESSVDATMLNNGSPKKQVVSSSYHQSSTTSPQVRRKLQEAALSEAMSAPGHSLRQRNALMASRSRGNTATSTPTRVVGPADIADGFDRHRSTSMPRLPQPKQVATKSASLSAFLSSKEKARNERMQSSGIKVKDEDQSGISSVTMTELKHQEIRRQQEMKEQNAKNKKDNAGVPEEEDESVPSHNSLDKEHRLDVTSALVCYQPTSLVNPFNYDSSDERQSPEHSSNESSPVKKEDDQELLKSPPNAPSLLCHINYEHPLASEHSLTESPGVEEGGHKSRQPVVAESPPNAPRLLCHLPTLEYSPLGGNDSVEAEKTIKVVDAVSPDRTIKTEAETSDEEELSSKDSADDGSSGSTHNEVKVKDSGDEDEAKPKDNASPSELPQSGEIAKDATSAIEYNIQNQGSKDLIECSIVQKVATNTDATASSILKRETMDSHPPRHHPPIAPRPSTTITGKPSSFAMAAAEKAIERAREASGGASTPRTILLEKQGWSHHHRYARHRSASAEDSPVIVPLNHLSSAVVLSSGVTGGTNGKNDLDHSGHSRGMASAPKVVESAKELTELHSWTAELSELRAWKVDAERSLKEYEQELVSREAWEVEIKKEYEEDARAEVELLKGQVSTLLHEREQTEASLKEQNAAVQKLEECLRVAKSDAAEWKSAAEEAVTESGKEIAELSQSNDEKKQEIEYLHVELESCNKKLKTTGSAAQDASSKVTELSQSNDTLTQENERLRTELESCTKKLNTTEIAAKEASSRISSLQSNIDKLEEKLTESQSAESTRAAAAEESRELNLSLTTKLRQLQEQMMSQDKARKESGRQLQESLRVTEVQVSQLKDRVGVMTKDSAKLQAELDAANITKELMASELNDLKARQEAEEIKRVEVEGRETSETQLLQEQVNEKEASIRSMKDQYESSIRVKDCEIDKLKIKVEALSKDACELGSKLVQATSTTESKCVELDALQEKLTVTMSSSQDSLRAKQDEINQLNDQVKILSEDVSRLTAELDEANETNKAIALDLSELQEVSSTEIYALQNELKAAISSSQESAHRLEAKNEEIDQLKDQVDTLQTEVNAAMAATEARSLEEYNSVQVEAMNRKLFAKEEKVVKLKSKVSSLNLQAKELSMSLVELCDWKSNAEAIMSDDANKIADLEKELSALRSQAEDTKASLMIALDEKKQAEAALEEKDREMDVLAVQAGAEEIRIMRSELDSISDKLSTAHEQLELSKRDIAIVEAERDEALAKSTDLQSSLVKLQAENNLLSADLKESESKCMKIESQMEEDKSRYSANEMDHQEQISMLVQERDDFATKFEECSLDAARLGERLSTVESDRDQALIEVEQHRSAVSNKEEELLSLRTENAEVITNLEKALADTSRLSIELKDLQQELNAATLAKETALSELALLEKLVEDSSDENHGLIQAKSEKVANLQERLATEQSTSSELRKRLEADVMAKGMEAEQLKIDLERACSDAELVKANLESESRDLKKWRVAAESLIETKDTELKSLREKIQAFQESSEELENTIQMKEKEIIDIKSDYEKALSDASLVQAELTADVEFLEQELQENKVMHNKALMEERGPRHDTIRRLETALSVREKELDSVRCSLREAQSLSRKMQTEVDSLNLVIETSRVDKEEASAAIMDLQEQLKIASEDLILKSEEVAELTADVERLQQELQGNKDVHNRVLMEERGPRLEETRRLEITLSAREKELENVRRSLQKAESAARKMQTEVDSLNLVIETSRVDKEKASAEIVDLQEHLKLASEDLTLKSEEVVALSASLERLEEEMQTEVDSLNLVIETSRVDNEKASAEIMDLQEQLKAASDSLAVKSEEVVALSASVERLEEELQGNKDAHRKALMEERGPRLEETGRLQIALSAKEKEVNQLKCDLRDAVMATRKLQTEIDSLNLVNESSHAEEEKALAKVAGLNEQLQTASETIAEKSDEISRLLADIECLEQKMNEQERSSAEKLVKERGIRLDETRTLSSTLSAREKEVDLLKNEIKEAAVASRKMQSEIGSLNLLIEPKDAEISALREKMSDADKVIEELRSSVDKATEEQHSLVETVSTLQSQCKEKEEEIIDRETDISFLTGECEELSSLISKLQEDMKMLEKKLETAELAAAAQFEDDKTELKKQIDLLQLDGTSKLDVISDLINKNNELLEEIDSLNAWKAVSEQEKMASEILAQRIVDLEIELERQRTKYQSAMKALEGMEQALLTVEKQRKKG